MIRDRFYLWRGNPMSRKDIKGRFIFVYRVKEKMYFSVD